MSDSDSPAPKRQKLRDTLPLAVAKNNDGNGVIAKARSDSRPGTECPYMHTINRGVLDFDFEKVCSVSLESQNVYACLVCGKYFQGRGPNSHAYAHCLDVGHHLFLNLRTELTYCLPENYNVVDPSLDAIAFALHPKFTAEDVESIDNKPHTYRILDGSLHLQGITGMDNLHASDYANVVFQMLLTVAPLRNFLLLASRAIYDPASKPSNAPERVIYELCALTQKVWSPAAFRGHVSPHELMQEVSNASNRRFSSLRQSNPTEFCAWLVNLLHRELNRLAKTDFRPPTGRARSKTLTQSCFQGKLRVSCLREAESSEEVSVKTLDSTFWFLSLDLPPKPLFKDASERTLVTQVPLEELLTKYDGQTQHHVVESGERRSYTLLKLPPYLILNINRVTKNKFSVEKNPAVVHCPVSDLDMSPLCPSDPESSQSYQLLAMVIHDGSHDSPRFRVVVRHRATRKWYNIHDLSVSEVLPQLASLSDTTILLYEKIQ